MMTNSSIQVVCHRNQVRSPFLAAFLQSHFPEMEFSSSGVSALSLSKFDERAAQLAMEWGFPYPISDCKTISAEFSQTLFLPADSEIRKELENRFLANNVLPSGNESFYSHHAIPIDPINTEITEMKYELAKLLGYGVRLLSSLKSVISKHEITAVIPKTIDSYPEIFKKIKSEIETNHIMVVDASLKDSNRSLLQDLQLELRLPLETIESGVVYSASFEVVESEKVLCSVKWHEWLLDLAKMGRVLIVTPPMEDQQGALICDSFLASIWSQNALFVDYSGQPK